MSRAYRSDGAGTTARHESVGALCIGAQSLGAVGARGTVCVFLHDRYYGDDGASRHLRTVAVCGELPHVCTEHFYDRARVCVVGTSLGLADAQPRCRRQPYDVFGASGLHHGGRHDGGGVSAALGL